MTGASNADASSRKMMLCLSLETAIMEEENTIAFPARNR